MSLGDGSGLSAADIMALSNNNDGFGGGAGFGWWIILFILLLGGGFWGGRGWGGNGGGGNDISAMAVPYMYNAGVQQGFDQSAIMTALSNLNTAIANGFAAVSVDSCNKAMANMQAINGVQMQMADNQFGLVTNMNNNHNALMMQMANNEAARQQCCCDSKLQMAQFQATMLAEHCSDRAEIDRAMNALSTQMNAGFQGVYDKMAQSRYDDLMAKYNETLQRLNRAENAASQNALAQTLIANNQAQTDRIMDFMNPPYARPFYGWPQMQPQSCCGNS